MYQTLACFIIILGLTGCAQAPSRYSMRIDSAPIQLIPDHEPSPVIPKYEPYRMANMRAYTINGIRYHPLLDGKGYAQTGGASWYGQKFHGHLTSNGEVFDMYEFTAAHKTLPLPSYVRVTNLANNNSLIVRVNDRGPFHPGRIIDLSFAAAKALDFLKTGTTDVHVEVIHIDEDNQVTVGNGTTRPYADAFQITPQGVNILPLAERQIEPVEVAQNAPQPPLATPSPAKAVSAEVRAKTFIQVVALSDPSKAQSLAEGLGLLYQNNGIVSTVANLHKILLGPFSDTTLATLALNDLQENGYPSAFLVTQ